MSKESLTHDRWWIDKKLCDIKRFEQRQLQLIIIIITLSSPKLPPSTTLGLISWFGIFSCTIVLIAIYLYFSWPWKIKKTLGSSKQIELSVEVYDKKSKN